ncbi:MAG TPA: hypothetical protein VGN95_24060 [Pyrinomonadaceae bacterium]|jgi:hypothetical protein|nr:hypothetical protein [Pyrinomonadaceae bacterium]
MKGKRLFSSSFIVRRSSFQGGEAGRHAWVQVARGAIEINGQPLSQGDGAAASEEKTLTIVGLEPSEILLFDLA